MDNLIQTLCDFPDIDIQDETTRYLLTSLIEIAATDTHTENLRKFSQLDLKQLENYLYYATHWQYTAALAEAHFDKLTEYLQNQKIHAPSSDILLPLVIELLPDNLPLLEKAQKNLLIAAELELKGKIGYIFITLLSAIQYKLSTPNHSEMLKLDPTLAPFLYHIGPIKELQKQIQLPSKNISPLINAIKLENKNHEYVVKWLEIAWREYQRVMNEMLLHSLISIGKYKLKSISDLNAYIIKHAPSLYKKSILPNEINLYFVIDDMMYTLTRKPSSYTDRLIEFNEKLLYQSSLLKNHEILSIIKYNLDKINFEENKNLYNGFSFFDYLPTVSLPVALPFNFFKRDTTNPLEMNNIEIEEASKLLPYNK